MYHIAICDDDPSAVRENEALLCRVLEARRFQRDTDFSIAAFSAAEPLLASLRERPFQLLVLDIELARENGVELAARLRESQVACSIIYITSYEEYMPDSFATRPLDYLMKPVDEDKLAKAIDWDLRTNFHPERLALPVRGGFRKLAVRDILYAEAVNHKSAVYLPGETVSVSLSFRDLLARLPGDTFCQCHHSFAVNLNHVHKQTARGLLLDAGIELPISRTYRQEFAKRFVDFIQ